MNEIYVIECRHPDGTLDFADPQPDTVFGDRAIHGITTSQMAHVIYKRDTAASLHGTNIPEWPAVIDKRWRARRKSW